MPAARPPLAQARLFPKPQLTPPYAQPPKFAVMASGRRVAVSCARVGCSERAVYGRPIVRGLGVESVYLCRQHGRRRRQPVRGQE